MFNRILGAVFICLVAVAAVACGDTTPSATLAQPAAEIGATPQPTAPSRPEAEIEPAPSEPTTPATATVTGTVTYRERIALSPDAVVEVKLLDVSRADAPAVTIGEQVIQDPGQVPIAFEIEYAPTDIDERFTYAVQVRIMEGDRLEFINDTAYHVITRGNPNQVDLVLVKVGEAPSEPAPSEPEPVAFEIGPCAMTLAAQLPIEFEFFGTVPTGFDGINQANCTFTKPVKTVTVMLSGPAKHTEVFTLSQPTTEVSFPLPEGTLSISTLEIVPPGEYQREMTVTSVDGDTLVISDQPGVLKTVTIVETTEFTFSFENDDRGWLTGFADLPANFEQSAFELDSGHRPLPAGLEGSGMYLQGHNRSDDLFMFLKRQVEGLRPDTAYVVTVSLDLATNVPGGLVGIGGSPGESVYVKAGASAVEPFVEEDDTGYLGMNIDKGNQATEGEAMINLGNVAHPEVTGDEYKIKTLHNQGRPFEVVSDNEGRIWLIAGTDSGFEGLSAFYYTGITYIFTTV